MTITTVVTMAITMAVLLGASWLAANYLWSLPYAPECPTCKRMTSQTTRTSHVDRLLARASSVSVRHCLRCGWSGRMRWRLAAERVTRK
ncbi:hypothetical protein [Longimicrobium sp.]|uniref:hypothetical protein n=1 Tax=Longimicrobium sp. TaxID=2029185 RepID=UPI003B3B988C